MPGNAISSQPSPTGKPPSSKKPPAPASASPITGTTCVTAGLEPLISLTKSSTVVRVAASDLATDSVEGQRGRPSGVMRLDLLNVVGSRPARLARPEADKPAWAASRSIAVQIWLCVSMGAPLNGVCGSHPRLDYSPPVGIITSRGLCPATVASGPRLVQPEPRR